MSQSGNQNNNLDPQPKWSVGDKIQSPVEKMNSIDFEKIELMSRYKLIVSSIVPRPIAFVSTLSRDGVPNLAPFSFFNGISSEPPCVIFSPTYKAGGLEKDTLKNIRETGEFVVNFVSEWMAEPMHQTSAEYAPEVDEMKEVGLTPIPSSKVKPQRVKESPIHWECKLEQLVDIGDKKVGSTCLVIGRVVMLHVYDKAFVDGRIDFDQLKPVARIGGRDYVKMGERFSLWNADSKINKSSTLDPT